MRGDHVDTLNIHGSFPIRVMIEMTFKDQFVFLAMILFS